MVDKEDVFKKYHSLCIDNLYTTMTLIFFATLLCNALLASVRTTEAGLIGGTKKLKMLGEKKKKIS